eukprot:CAMPEP_0204341596 /NCGR_PEP_ID=MMETSP0469-20131031/23486_1 /ASSEMBLY_ACC=CAM_ASM_000384 /TAXON_ID=2969 /ORGANISM="Oxyrrhis marina" /LENGTH=53 /DNA_ID=CAMNT_0051326351 /DNA_START=170 /DNA_END=327 /DNA_ORIENTATION=+
MTTPPPQRRGGRPDDTTAHPGRQAQQRKGYKLVMSEPEQGCSAPLPGALARGP